MDGVLSRHWHKSLQTCDRAPTKRYARQWLRPLLASMVLLLALHPTLTVAGTETIHIEVDGEQRVTVVGRASSLRMVISDLCIRAGVELVSYNAPDRPFSANYELLPLLDVLPRLLGQESHTLRTRTDGGQVRVARLEVIRATNPGTPSRTESSPTTNPGSGLWLPLSLMEAAFASPDTTRREEALLAIGEHILGDELHYQQFLLADAKWMAGVVHGYPYTRPMLERLRDTQGEGPLAAKVTAIIDALKNPPKSPRDDLKERILSRTSP